MRVRVCIYITCVYVYAFTLQVPAFTLHACMCMHVRYMRVRVCIYIACVYVYGYDTYIVCLHMHKTCMYLYGTCHAMVIGSI